MYGKVIGASSVTGTGALLLPNTGGNVALTVVALTTTTVGVIALLSTLARIVSKKAYKA